MREARQTGAPPRARAAALVAAVWAGFVCAGFLGVVVYPLWTLRQGFSEQEFLLAGEAWWRGQARPRQGPHLVVLEGGDCACPPGPAAERLYREAVQRGVPVMRVAASAGPDWGLAASLPAGSAVDTLLFDAEGRLSMAFLGDDPDHCAAAGARLQAGLAGATMPRVWPGLCPCG